MALSIFVNFFKPMILAGMEDPETRRAAARDYMRAREEQASFLCAPACCLLIATFPRPLACRRRICIAVSHAVTCSPLRTAQHQHAGHIGAVFSRAAGCKT